jgi:hypothetical protein
MLDVEKSGRRSAILGPGLGFALAVRRVRRRAGLMRVSFGARLAVGALVLFRGGRGVVLVVHARRLAKPAPSAL